MFLIIAPAIGYPLSWAQTPRLLEVILPVFFGYLGSATHFIFQADLDKPDLEIGVKASLLTLIIKGPIFIFTMSTIAVIYAFGYSNRIGGPPGDGMSLDQLAASLAAIIGLLAVTTSVAVSYLFSLGEQIPKAQSETKSV